MTRHAISNTSFVLPAAASTGNKLITTRSLSRSASSAIPDSQWKTLIVPDRYLRLNLTLRSGQSFLWREMGTFPFPPSHTGVAREWAGPIGDRLFILRQAHPQPPESVDDPVWYRVHSESAHEHDVHASHQLVKDYFRADVDHTKLMRSFCEADDTFSAIFPHYKGLRTIRAHPEECLFSFICSSNNNIKRITTLVTHLATAYGQQLGTHGGYTFHAFPRAETLAAEANEQDLREAGFGYRARFIPATAREIARQAAAQDLSAERLLLSWRSLSRKQVSNELVKFMGIGRKVAGCIALMSLDQHGEIPVDTHVWQISKRYMPDLEGRSLTDRVYDRIGDFFRKRFGEDVAGFAHNVLFIAELSDFKQVMAKTKTGVFDVSGLKKVKKAKTTKKNNSGDNAARTMRNTRAQNGVRKKTKRGSVSNGKQ
eukprot:TRINITY_DN493_c0_g1_i1.p1 TRINITY_DN493_c0_g1~~TRINITY_DN493_c0_g1_i1.p1  ORF type:complete len:427 (+),score=52.39 TRINITY_DN493_c0_g1_i1:124-1404(+)